MQLKGRVEAGASGRVQSGRVLEPGQERGRGKMGEDEN